MPYSVYLSIEDTILWNHFAIFCWIVPLIADISLQWALFSRTNGVRYGGASLYNQVSSFTEPVLSCTTLISCFHLLGWVWLKIEFEWGWEGMPISMLNRSMALCIIARAYFRICRSIGYTTLATEHCRSFWNFTGHFGR